MERWQNQEEAVRFALSHPACMMDMEMGTGKTRVALDTAFERSDVNKILIVCPKAVIGVWRENLIKFHDMENWVCWDKRSGTVKSKAEDLATWLNKYVPSISYTSLYEETPKKFVIINYDSVWREPMGDLILKNNFHMVILDESHRAKAAGSKVSKYLAMLGKRVRYKMCLSGTPMANSPLDVYGQYRFLDSSIYGTNHFNFLQEFAVLGGPDRRFVVGYKNQKELNRRFKTIAYTCKMSEIADRIKLPDALPPIKRMVDLPTRDMKTIKQLNKEFIAECMEPGGFIVVNNVLTKLLRIQQICSGFCKVQDSAFDAPEEHEMNNVKQKDLEDILKDVALDKSVVVFCVFKHDIEAVRRASKSVQRRCYELSGAENTLEDWKKDDGAVIAVQVQAGSEGVDMTKAQYAVYFSMPRLAMYNQSKARLYRPGQKNSVSFIHIIAKDTIDEAMYDSVMRKEDIIESIKNGTFDFGYVH